MDFYTNLAISVLLQVIRDPKQNSRWRKALLKIFREIALQFGSDPDFQKVAQVVHEDKGLSR